MKARTLKDNIEDYLDEMSEINISRNIEKDNSELETLHLLSTKMNRQQLIESINQMENGKLEFYNFDGL